MSIHMFAPAIDICSLAEKLAFLALHYILSGTRVWARGGRGVLDVPERTMDIAPGSRYCSALVASNPSHSSCFRRERAEFRHTAPRVRASVTRWRGHGVRSRSRIGLCLSSDADEVVSGGRGGTIPGLEFPRNAYCNVVVHKGPRYRGQRDGET
jgi:hypothetical protein